MKIAVLSDIHDRLDNLSLVLVEESLQSCDVLLFLGDFCAPFSLAHLAEGFTKQIHAVFGNNDGDQFLLSQIAAKFGHVTLHGQFAEFEFDSKKIAINHYPDISKRIAEGPSFDAVFSGHDHQRYIHQFENTIWANPGEIMGRFGNPSFGIYDTESHSFQHVILES